MFATASAYSLHLDAIVRATPAFGHTSSCAVPASRVATCCGCGVFEGPGARQPERRRAGPLERLLVKQLLVSETAAAAAVADAVADARNREVDERDVEALANEAQLASADEAGEAEDAAALRALVGLPTRGFPLFSFVAAAALAILVGCQVGELLPSDALCGLLGNALAAVSLAALGFLSHFFALRVRVCPRALARSLSLLLSTAQAVEASVAKRRAARELRTSTRRHASVERGLQSIKRSNARVQRLSAAAERQLAPVALIPGRPRAAETCWCAASRKNQDVLQAIADLSTMVADLSRTVKDGFVAMGQRDDNTDGVVIMSLWMGADALANRRFGLDEPAHTVRRCAAACAPCCLVAPPVVLVKWDSADGGVPLDDAPGVTVGAALARAGEPGIVAYVIDCAS